VPFCIIDQGTLRLARLRQAREDRAALLLVQVRLDLPDGMPGRQRLRAEVVRGSDQLVQLLLDPVGLGVP
jgi:hypothetical protein